MKAPDVGQMQDLFQQHVQHHVASMMDIVNDGFGLTVSVQQLLNSGNTSAEQREKSMLACQCNTSHFLCVRGI